MATQGAPISVEPSGDFLGHDGEWSAFLLRVGTPPQTVRVLVSTQVPEIWLVDSEGCTKQDPSNCTEARGGKFLWADSSTSERHDVQNLEAESNLGMNKNSDVGRYGLDIVRIGRRGNGEISPSHLQMIATVATKDFFVGNIGLSARGASAAKLGKQPGLLSSLNDGKYIPSLSYGYTAGAAYKKSNASLTLGGVDRAKFTPNDVEFSLATPETRELVVQLQSLVSTDAKGNETSLLVKKIPMLLDSTVPHIWLPVDTCQQFERAFDLGYDPISNFYYINDTVHDRLTKEIATITFGLGASEAGGSAVNITLPYASLDLEVSPYHPEAKRASKYLPLRQAHDEGQYTLGRAFFQESYLKVDYENRTFSVSQALHAPDSSSDIIAIPSAQATGTATEPTNPGSEPKPPITTTSRQASPKSGGLGTPAIAGIIVGVVILLAALIGWFLLRCRRRRKAKKARRDKAELASDHPYPRDVCEVDGSERPDPQKGGPEVTVEEKEQRRMDQTEVHLMDQGNSGSHESRVELAADIHQPELASHDSYHRVELPSPEPGLRSELVTPEPITRSELSTPEPEWRGSSDLPDSTIVGDSSPPLDGGPSPVSSPGSLWSPRRREVPARKDSPESEGGWSHTRSMRRPRPSLRHSRVVSSESESNFPLNRAPSDTSRPTHARMDSSESESGVAPGRWSSMRPSHRRLDSNDSVTTVETRLALNSPGMSLFQPRPSHDRHERPVQALPSLGLDPSPFNPSPSLESIKSGLLSPAPLDYVDEEKARDFRHPGQKSEDRSPPKDTGRS